MQSRLLFLLAVLISLFTLGVLWLTDLPLGVSGEWVWGRIVYDRAEIWDALLTGLLIVFIGGVYCGLVWKAVPKIDAAGFVETTVWLIGLMITGFCWLFVVQLTPPAGYGISKSVWVLYYPMASGYFHEAKTRPEPMQEYLANYEEDIQTKDNARRVLHHGTHPPGLFIAYRGLISLCDSSPGLAKAILSTQPGSVRAMFEEIKPSPPDSERAVIWLATLLTQLLGAMVVLPLFLLARQISSPRAAFLAASCWPLIPAMAVFLPKSDVLYAFLGMTFLAAWWISWRGNFLLGCFLAGIVLAVGMLLSLALLPIAFLAAVITLWDFLILKENPKTWNRIFALLLAGFAGFSLPGLLLWQNTGINIVMVWWQNYQNHAEFYQHFSRSYSAWFLVNPLETLFALGAPMGVMCCAGIGRCVRNRKHQPRVVWGPIAGVLLMMSLLWISGKNQGEAARLWLVVFPCVVWLTAPAWEENASPKFSSWILAWLGLQLLVCSLTVARVNGFPI